MNIIYTIKHHLCLGCGLCEDICPTNSIDVRIIQGEYKPSVDESTCLGDKCSRCTKICPGLGVNLKELSQKRTVSEPVKKNPYIGHYVQLYTGHCTDYDIRYHSASGGMVTGLLIYLLERGIIQGAVVTRFSDKDHLTPKPFIARNREELISARSSKYCPVSMQGIRKQIRESEGKYVIVGLPCHLHGFHKIEEMDPKFREHIFAYWGLYCSSGRTFNLTDYVLQHRHIQKDGIRYFAYRDEGCLGSMVVKYENRKIIVDVKSQNFPYREGEKRIHKESFGNYYNLRSYFIPRRCHFCIDHSAELSDISFGDIHIKPYSEDTIGMNSVIVRTRKMRKLLMQAVRDGVIVLDDLKEEVLISSQKMAQAKKNKYASLVYWGKKIGLTVPQYDTQERGRMGFLKAMVYLLNMNLQYQVGHHRWLWFIIKYTIKNISVPLKLGRVKY